MATRTYNPGTATVPVKIAPSTYSIDSFRGEEKSYTVSLEFGTCSCPHFAERLAGTGQDCKHLKAVRALQFDELLAKARKAADADLPRLLQKYEAKGDLATAIAIRCEMADRDILATL